MTVTLLDAILVGIMLISALLAMVRGFSREVLSVVSWLAAAAAAFSRATCMAASRAAMASGESLGWSPAVSGTEGAGSPGAGASSGSVATAGSTRGAGWPPATSGGSGV